ncbi:MAG: SAM-dependent methyltransferase [Verrucomicrobiota bacterium]
MPSASLPSSNAPLTDLLRRRIAESGAIPFHDFMAEALYQPEFGYYASGKAAIGRAGDFFTNVSVGPLFGALLARQFEEMWKRLGMPARFDLVEQGAHRGLFAADLLRALELVAPDCFRAARYTFVEPNPVQREAQAAAIAPWKKTEVRWVEKPEALPEFEGVHFSNELIDAFPVHLVTWTGEKWIEQHVEWAEERFRYVPGKISSNSLAAHLELIPRPLPANYTTEVNLAALHWIDALAGRLGRGYLLAIDYGFSRIEYYRPERPQGTLTGYARHERIDDLLENPGEIDLTAHVDFTTLIEQAERAGLHLQGFTDQHHFMVGLSRLHFQDAAAITPQWQRDMRAFKTLMHPALMGASFKALCLGKGVPSIPPLSGFSMG